jgi:hypothetical protein
MNSKECEEQLKSLIEAWDLDEACLNQTDIEAIKHLMLENQMQQKEIKGYQAMYFDKVMIINKAIEYIIDKKYWDGINNYRLSNADDLLEILKEDNKEKVDE